MRSAKADRATDILDRLGISEVVDGACGGEWIRCSGPELESVSPIDESVLGRVRTARASDYEKVVTEAQDTFARWRMHPAPQRGLVVRAIGDELRRHKDDLGALVTLETGKIWAEGKGEVQEMIDIADFAVGLSRQLYGLTMHSERPLHRMYEQWHPLGVVGVISRVQFSRRGLVMECADRGGLRRLRASGSRRSKTPLTAIAVQQICHRVLERHGWEGVLNLVIGSDEEIGERLIDDRRMPLISATGSTRMGQRVARRLRKRMGRTLLELGGNNGVIVMDDADLDLALRGSSVRSGGNGRPALHNRSRRLFLQEAIAGTFRERLIAAYGQMRIGDPMDESTLIGSADRRGGGGEHGEAHSSGSVEQGGAVLVGGGRVDGHPDFMSAGLVKARHDMPIVHEETFAPILYLIEFDDLDEVIALAQRSAARLIVGDLHD